MTKIIAPCFVISTIVFGSSVIDFTFAQSDDTLKYFAKGKVIGDDFNGGPIWTQINNGQMTIIDVWNSQRTKFQSTITHLPECESNYNICLDAKVTSVHNTAAVHVGDEFVVKIDTDNKVQKYIWFSGSLENFEITTNIKKISKKTSKNIVDVGNDIFPKDIDEYTFAHGNLQSNIIIIDNQGGPETKFDHQGLSYMYDPDMNAKLQNALFVNMHQIQTLHPELFDKEVISFEKAKQYDKETTQMLYEVVKYFKNDEKKVYVLGTSFGAFVVQDLIATHGNVADGYLIAVGRLNIQDEFWEAFSNGNKMIFENGTTPKTAQDEEAGMGSDNPIVDKNMPKLAAGLGYKRYAELLAGINLSNVVYIYGQADEQVGRLSGMELEFLHNHNATVLKSENGHVDAVDEKLYEGILKMVGLS